MSIDSERMRCREQKCQQADSSGQPNLRETLRKLMLEEHAVLRERLRQMTPEQRRRGFQEIR